MILISIIAGNISLKVPASLESKLDLKADSVSVDKQFDMASLVCTKSDAQEHVTGIVRRLFLLRSTPFGFYPCDTMLACYLLSPGVSLSVSVTSLLPKINSKQCHILHH